MNAKVNPDSPAHPDYCACLVQRLQGYTDAAAIDAHGCDPNAYCECDANGYSDASTADGTADTNATAYTLGNGAIGGKRHAYTADDYRRAARIARNALGIGR